VTGPILEKLAKENPEIEFVQFEAGYDVCRACGVGVVPTFQFYKNKIKIDVLERDSFNPTLLSEKVAKHK